MSRCFPFPPPGYEKKARIDDADLLTKEKQTEKKNKEKKDKEKREGKEKKGEEKSKEKYKEKKDRKEKRKEKDKDREKDKNHTSADKRVEGKPDFPNGVKHGPNILPNAEIKDSKFVQDLARRIMDGDRATGSQMAQNIRVTDQRGAQLSGRVVEGNVGDQSSKKEKTKHNKDDRKVSGLTNHVDARRLENTVVQGFSQLHKKLMEGKEKSERGESFLESRGLENRKFPDFPGTDRKRVEHNARPGEEKNFEKQMDKRGIEGNARMEKIVDKQMDEKDRIKLKESETKGEKCKDRDREKKSKSKDKDRDRKKEKKERKKEKTEPSKQQQPKLIVSRKDTLDTCIIEPSQHLESTKNSIGEGILGKHKDSNMNGFVLGNGIWPNKLPRTVSSSQPVMENGRMETCQTAICFEFEMQVIASKSKADFKEHKVNGLIEAPRTKPSSALVNENGDTSKKRLHPDSHILKHLLILPKMEEWSDFDEQDWLFSSDRQNSKKPKTDSPSPGATQEVWSEALHIETADVLALPYVIPY